eukprot:m.218116 g.218116  ORF g.218116 m.218116 type:complete len:59 (-) comp17213_c0_seq3:1060-1236(-)
MGLMPLTIVFACKKTWSSSSIGTSIPFSMQAPQPSACKPTHTEVRSAIDRLCKQTQAV